MQFPEQFPEYLAYAVGEKEAAAALDALCGEPSVSIRFNPSKLSALGQMPAELSDCLDAPVPWSPHGHFLGSRPLFTLDPLFHGGLYYVQDSSAMFVGEMFRRVLEPVRGQILRVLDLCAAPGGKTTDLCASLREACGENFLLVANEPVRTRAAVLAENVVRWGDPNVMVTCADPAAFADLEGFFDIIVADVPCSGEGMFRKDEEALRQWSPDNVALCQGRQRRIAADVWPALAQGGVFVYSTCTFNCLENDGNMEWICSNLGAEVLEGQPDYEGVLPTRCGRLLVPGNVGGEGQFCSAVRKIGGQDFRSRAPKMKEVKAPASVGGMFKTPVRMIDRGGTLLAVPESIFQDASHVARLRTLMTGVAVGQMKGRDFVPDADLALCHRLGENAFPTVELSRGQALAFLHRDAMPGFPDEPRGILLMRHCGLPLGFVKNIGQRCNSLWPQSRRIRMTT